jgi:excisionase family DNA binding protein
MTPEIVSDVQKGFPLDTMMTIEEAANRLRMSPAYMRRLIAERRIAVHRFGRRVRLSEADVLAFVAGCRVSAAERSPVRLVLEHVDGHHQSHDYGFHLAAAR